MALHGMRGQPRLPVAYRQRLKLRRSVSRIRFLQCSIGSLNFPANGRSCDSYATGAGIQVVGDIPIYVALDSADVWTNREYFYLSEDLQPEKIAGVPPIISAPPDNAGATPSTTGID